MALPVDIVVNNYNYDEFVGEAVASALAQDHSDVHVIVVDDGSTDGSVDKLLALEGQVELVLKDNGGQASALNAGFARCRGELVIFLDADDLLSPFAASRAAAALALDPDAARVQFQVQEIDARGQLIPRRPGSAGRPPMSGDLRGAELSFPFEMSAVPTSGNAFRTELLREIMPIPEAEYGSWCADYYLVHLTTLLGSVISLEEVGAHYRLHGRNGFQPTRAHLDLTRLRREVHYQMVTMQALADLADKLALPRPVQILSMSNIALRLVSLKLDPASHPLPDDRLAGLLRMAGRAARRRYDLAPMLRILLVGAMAAIAVAPYRIAWWLSELLVFPELRRRRREGKSSSRPAARAIPSTEAH